MGNDVSVVDGKKVLSSDAPKLSVSSVADDLTSLLNVRERVCSNDDVVKVFDKAISVLVVRVGTPRVYLEDSVSLLTV